ncbi:matrilysin-like [Planococcus citri]|uniref:matrilysin-like n=1 Tax=Planococcus citri TaxID=170843 RepID=UPI0031F79B5C
MFLWLELLISRPIVVFVSFNIFSVQFEITDASEVLNETQAMIHLAQYGYLALSVDEIQSGKRVSKEDLSRALKEFQDFNNLHSTGNLDVQTMSKLQEPRCGFPDETRNSRTRWFKHSNRKWIENRITFAFEHDSKKLPPHVTHNEIYRAFKTWEEFIPIKFDLADKEKPNILVSFETGKHQDQAPFDGPLGILAHATGPQESRLHPSFAHFDDDENWHVENEKNNDDGPNLYQVAVHEIGHTLGLYHSNDTKSVMRAHYPGSFNPNFKMPLDDVYAIQTLYPKKRKLKGPNGKPLYTTVPPRPKRKRRTTRKPLPKSELAKNHTALDRGRIL